MESFSVVIKSFENFIKRSLMPSASFLIMYMVFDIYYYKDSGLFHFLKSEHYILMIIFVIIAFAGLSTMLTILHQFFYDNNLKDDYDSLFLFKNENENLKNYRNDVIAKLNTEFKTDYLLYQQLGFIADRDKKKFETKRYVDDAKTIGIFFISLFIMIIILTTKYLADTDIIFSLSNFAIVIFVVAILFFLFKLGKELILSKYRSRAIRIYTNYILDESSPKKDSLEKEKEGN